VTFLKTIVGLNVAVLRSTHMSNASPAKYSK